ncbi:MAG: polysaccharide biosynthesis protein, partial [Chlorobiales bacterium]|nr:polysaccharide biosynthesis protein [Chlorobiales bacterium]
YPNRYEWLKLLLLFVTSVVFSRLPVLAGKQDIWFETVLTVSYLGVIVVVFRNEVEYIFRQLRSKLIGSDKQ